jgi:hypothetical protein
MLGTKWIYEPILKRLAKDRFDLKIDSVHLRWLQPLEFRGIAVSHALDSEANAKASQLLKIRSIRSNRSLLGYLLNGRHLGQIEIIEPSIDIALLEDGTNVEKLVKAIRGPDAAQPAESKPAPKVDLDIVVRGLSVQLEPSEGSPLLSVVPPFDVALAYRALQSEPSLVISPAKVLDHAPLTQELVRLGLGKAIPLLAKSAWFDGSISLSTEEIRIPLQDPNLSTGKAQLTLHQVRSGPSEPLIVGALDALARLRNKEPSHEIVFVDGSQVRVEVADQRIFHTGLEAGLPKLDPRLQVATQGYVGLQDRTLDLSLEIPVPIEQLARREVVQKLGVPKVKLPIGGTLDDPQIQWETMRGESAALLALIATRLQSEAPLTSSLVDAIGGVTEGQADQAIAAAVDFVKSLRERRNASQSESEREENKEPSTENETRRPLRDALRKAIRGK